jgi:hypothetical protein
MLSGRNEADRFVIGLLRASADAVLIGAGILRPAPDSLWTPVYIYADTAVAFAELRRRLGRSDEPAWSCSLLEARWTHNIWRWKAAALVMRTKRGARKLRDRLSGSSTVVALGNGRAINLVDVMTTLRSEGHQVVLSECGSTGSAACSRRGFSTSSSALCPRSSPVAPMPVADPGSSRRRSSSHLGRSLGDLLGVRKDGSHLFLRYAIST